MISFLRTLYFFTIGLAFGISVFLLAAILTSCDSGPEYTTQLVCVTPLGVVQAQDTFIVDSNAIATVQRDDKTKILVHMSNCVAIRSIKE